MPFSVAMMESETSRIGNRAAGPGKAYGRDSVLLWIIQGLLAATFLFAGGMKLVMPDAALTEGTHLPGLFIRFIGVAEVLGAVGLILPGALKVRPTLTPLAACGLTLVMIGATIVTLAGSPAWMGVIPATVGILCACVAYGRSRVAPHRGNPNEA